MSSLVVLKQMMMIFILIMTGFIMHKKNLISEAASKDMSAMVVNLCSPALVIFSMFSDNTAISRKSAGLSMVVGILYFLMLILLGKVLGKILKVSEDEKDSYTMMSTFGNLGFIGIPVALAIIGPASMVYVVIFNFLYNVIMYTYGVALLRKGGAAKKSLLRNLCTPGVFSCIIAFLIYWFQIEVPVNMQSLIGYFANACTLLSMMVVGMSLVHMKVKDVMTNKKLLLFTAIRFVIVPAAMAILLKPVLTDYVMRASVILMLALPAGNLPVMMSKQYGRDAEVIAEEIVLSTLLSVFTITFVFMFV